jgi:hypothetical protein
VRATDVLDTLTGHDEAAVAQATGTDIEEMGTFKLVRAMAAVVMSRTEEELPLPRAWAKVQGMRQSELTAWWKAQGEDEDEEVMEDDPVTESGKDDSATVSEPNS